MAIIKKGTYHFKDTLTWYPPTEDGFSKVAVAILEFDGTITMI